MDKTATPALGTCVGLDWHLAQRGKPGPHAFSHLRRAIFSSSASLNLFFIKDRGASPFRISIDLAACVASASAAFLSYWRD
jgi:hypothetical protein